MSSAGGLASIFALENGAHALRLVIRPVLDLLTGDFPTTESDERSSSQLAVFQCHSA